MIKKLAIKGHPTRGKEIIELLEMMGGKNSNGFICSSPNRFYYILNEYFCLDYIDSEEINEYVIFTLEEFLEKYPYKVGDVIKFPNNMAEEIAEMKWDEELEDIIYTSVSGWTRPCHVPKNTKNKTNMNENKFAAAKTILASKSNSVKLINHKCKREREDATFDGIIKKNNENKMKNVLAELLEHIKTTPKEDLEREFEEIEEWANVGPTIEEFRTFCECVNKKPEYPKTYEECRALLHLQDSIVDGCCGYEWRLVSNLQKLLLCRDAYWKIAGEKIGLNKSWEPDWGSFSEGSYPTITKCNGKIVKTSIYTHDCPLAFPTEEMRDAFYENFKDLIEQCKELL